MHETHWLHFDVHEKSTTFEKKWLYFTATSGVCLIRSGTALVFKRNYNRKKKSVHSPNLVRSFTKYFVKDLDPDL